MISLNELRRNQSRFPREELEKYTGQYVAWSEDGTRILASHADLLKLDANLIEAGHDPANLLVNFDSVPDEQSWGLFCAEDSA